MGQPEAVGQMALMIKTMVQAALLHGIGQSAEPVETAQLLFPAAAAHIMDVVAGLVTAAAVVDAREAHSAEKLKALITIMHMPRKVPLVLRV